MDDDSDETPRRHDTIRRTAARVIDDEAEEDLTQEVWISSPKKLASWRGEGKLPTRLHRVVACAARDARRGMSPSAAE